MKAKKIWLLGIPAFILLIVLVGGVTRLTGSGLSITEWKPLLGVIPPLTPVAWEEAFQKYQQIPQYHLLNSHMTLPEFKWIYFWEWLHRILGRVLGLYVAIGWIWLETKKQISPSLRKRLFLGLVLGGVQGFLGWFMVQSGLQEGTHVSPFRLMIHLSWAFLILSYFGVLCFREAGIAAIFKKYAPHSAHPRSNWLTCYDIAVLLFVLQIVWGSLVAGMKAGYGYPTFPDMNGVWIPSTSPMTFHADWVHWVHRWNGIGLWLFFLIAISYTPKPLRRVAGMLWFGLTLQALIGILTAVYQVPLLLGVLHQLIAGILVLVLTWWICHLRFDTRKE